jgi:hypothetical protein
VSDELPEIATWCRQKFLDAVSAGQYDLVAADSGEVAEN